MRFNISNQSFCKFLKKINFGGLKSIFFISSLLYFFIYFFYNSDQISFSIDLEKNVINLYFNKGRGVHFSNEGYKTINKIIMRELISIKSNDKI